MKEPIRYKGTRRDGTAVTGAVDADLLSGFTATRYRWGWKTLEARYEGDIVAFIGNHPGDGHRTWWAVEGLSTDA
jgi:hypothetical protein